ncbi:bifunctional AP-4-A phosphorylase/ADP sulfurylase [Exophiala oligosperma]
MPEEDMGLGLAERLQTLVSRKFQQAYHNKALLFSDTALHVLRINQGPSLRYCPALANKPKGNEKTEHRGPRFDPFADPSSDLLVTSIPSRDPSHILVLNKFPVIHNHFIIATKDNKPQTGLLEPADLSMTYECLRAWQNHQDHSDSQRLFAFFNSGEHSGASQVHRHLQFLSMEDMSGSDSQDWKLLIDRMIVPAHPQLPLFHDPSCPFLHFSTPIEGQPSAETLFSKYHLLLKAALSAGSQPHEQLNEHINVERDGETTFSYNLAITTDRMAICPRSHEAVAVPGLGQESSVALNGTILAGTLMVKHEQEWNTLREKPELLENMLASVGYSPAIWD